MGPGSVLGFLDANGGLPRSYRAVAETKVVLLKEPNEMLFDVLEDNFQLAIGMLTFLSRAVLEHTARVARAVQADATKPSSSPSQESEAS